MVKHKNSGDILRLFLNKFNYHLPIKLFKKAEELLRGIENMGFTRQIQFFSDIVCNIQSELYEDIFSFSAIDCMNGADGLIDWLKLKNNNKYY